MYGKEQFGKADVKIKSSLVKLRLACMHEKGQLGKAVVSSYVHK